MRGLVISSLVLLAACSAPPPHAADADAAGAASPRCVTPARIRAATPPAVRLIEITPPAPFLAALNALPPASAITADAILVGRRGAAARVFLFEHGCLTVTADLPWALIEQLAGAAS